MALSLAAALCALMAAPAGAAESKDARSERERVRRQRADLTSSVDALKASDVEVNRALDALEGQAKAEEARLAAARQAAEAAAQQAEVARRRQQQAEESVARMRAAVRDFAVEAYVNPAASRYVALLSSRSVNELARKQALLEAGTTHGREALDGLKAARDDLASQRDAAELAAARASERRREVGSKAQQVAAARDKQASFADSVEERLNAKLAEADSLAALDANLSAEITRREAAVAARVRATTAARAAPTGPGSARVASGAPGRSGAPTPAGVRGGVKLATVRGITVAAEIADNLERLLAAAEADGIVLGGSGYRDSSGQVALRRSNCGSSTYATYEMPASQCSPPTAKPGSSMHERGLAVDFTYQGRVISSRSNPAFQWLSRNAGRYGFYNLPSEPWHWSTNGN